MGSSDTWPKKLNTYVYSIEVRYLLLVSIVNFLHARVYWPFEGGASFVDLQLKIERDLWKQ